MPIRLHHPGAKSKAALHYYCQYRGYPDLYDYLPCEGAKIVTLTASSHAEAARNLKAQVLPGDRRPVMRLRAIKHFVVEDDRVHDPARADGDGEHQPPDGGG